MERIIIPPHYIHTRSTPFWTKETAPPSIWQRHLDADNRQDVYLRLSVMRGVILYCVFSGEDSHVPADTLAIAAGQFGVFSPGTWHSIKAVTDDALFSIDFYANPQILL